MARIDSVYHDIFCISVDLVYHIHPVDASWTCECFAVRGCKVLGEKGFYD